MELTYKEIDYYTNKTKIFYTNNQLKQFFIDTKNKYFCYLNSIFNNIKYNGLEKSHIENHNPILWEAGHPIFFIEKHCVRYLYPEDNYPLYPSKFYNNLYDSFIIKNEYRFSIPLPSFLEITNYYNELHDKICEYLDKTPVDAIKNTIYYMLMIVLLHLNMHLESYLFTNQLVYKINPFETKLNIDIYEDPIKIEFIDIPGGCFWQGYFEKSNKIGFDNEKNCFKTTVEKFSVSKTLITNHMYLKFINDNGYKNDEYWSFNGKLWKNNKLYKMYPLYWAKINNNWYVNYFGEVIPLKMLYNYPIVHISWYEAEAFCNWLGVRLLSETEWEYLSTNASETYYPWGDTEDNLSMCNLDYNNKWISSVKNNNILTNNKWNIEQLIGNCWEWCSEAIYPYNGFSIDPLYREMSYPFFGDKKICKGGSWCVPNYLITSSYRNGQYPETRKQFIGFRIAK